MSWQMLKVCSPQVAVLQQSHTYFVILRFLDGQKVQILRLFDALLAVCSVWALNIMKCRKNAKILTVVDYGIDQSFRTLSLNIRLSDDD